MPSRGEIAAAVAAYNDTYDREMLLLPTDTVRLLAIMFPRGTVYRGGLVKLINAGFGRRSLPRFLRSLIHAGFLSKEPGAAGSVGVYQLHLPPRRQP